MAHRNPNFLEGRTPQTPFRYEKCPLQGQNILNDQLKIMDLSVIFSSITVLRTHQKPPNGSKKSKFSRGENPPTPFRCEKCRRIFFVGAKHFEWPVKNNGFICIFFFNNSSQNSLEATKWLLEIQNFLGGEPPKTPLK